MGVSHLPATGLVAKAQGILDGVVANAAVFPAPEPSPALMQGYIDDLAAANAAVETEGGKANYQAKRTAEKVLRAAIKAWAWYVQNVSGGDEGKILLSRFEVVKRGAPIGELNPPQNLGAFLTNHSGRVALRWKREDGADMHHVFMSTTAEPFNWQLIGATSKSRFNADSLEPGTFYFFAVTALGAAGESSKSEPCRAMAAA